MTASTEPAGMLPAATGDPAPRRRAWLVPALVLAGISLASLWPILRTGDWYVSHQAYRYPYLMELFKASFLAGHAYPRWLPELFGGYGYPTFLYYPPGFWLLALPFALVLPNVIHAMYAALIVLLWLGGIGAYRLARLTLAPWPALFCAILFLTTPYFAVQLYTRGSLSELGAMALCPWVFLCLLRLKDALEHQRPATWPALWLALAMAAMVAMHLLIALWLAACLSLVMVVLLIGRDWPKGLLAVLSISAVLALALASPYWYPALAFRDAVAFQRAIWLGKPVPFVEFIALRPHMTGLVYSVLALAGFWLGRKQRWVQAVVIPSLVLLFLMLPTGWPIWKAIRQLQVTQHPGRIFSVFATLQLLGFIACVGSLTRRPRFTPRMQAVAALLALCVIGAMVQYQYRISERLDYARFRYEASRSFEDMTHNHEFEPRGAKIKDLPHRLTAQVPVAQSGAGTLLTIQSSRDDDIRLQAVVATAPATITLNQLAFPGWRLTLDDRPLPHCGQGEAACWRRDPHGRMQILLPASGSVALRAWFDGPPGWLPRTTAALIVLVLCAVLLRRHDRLRAAASLKGVSDRSPAPEIEA